MPKHTPNVKVRKTQSYGAEVILYGNDFSEASEYTNELILKKGLTLIHPYDDEEVIKGQGTIVLEMLKDYPDIDIFIIPVGGGGLISGNSISAKSINREIEILGVQTKNYPSMYQALKGENIKCGSSTIADGIAVKKPGNITLPIIKEYVNEIILVDEKEIEESVLIYLESESSVVEGAGAAGLAAVIADKNRFMGKKVGLIISGGNIDLLPLSSIIQRGLARSKRLARLKIVIPDIPGSLSDITELLGNKNANIIEVRHQRAFTNLSLRSAEVEFVIQTLGSEHLKEVIEAIKNSDYQVIVTDHNIY
jgi:threonine dehydratase